MESGRSRKTRCRSESGRDWYSKLKDDVSFRSMWCDKVDLGFRLVSDISENVVAAAAAVSMFSPGKGRIISSSNPSGKRRQIEID